jgi:hypothetical protein
VEKLQDNRLDGILFQYLTGKVGLEGVIIKYLSEHEYHYIRIIIRRE